MRRACSAVILILALTALIAPARAGLEIVPSSYKLLHGSTETADPVAAASNDDGTYLVNASKPRGAGHRVQFQLTFRDLPDVDGAWSALYQGLTSGAPCVLSIAVYHWRRERFIHVASQFTVGLGPAESNLTGQSTGLHRFVKRGKLRAKYSCAGASPFSLHTDRARIKR